MPAPSTSPNPLIDLESYLGFSKEINLFSSKGGVEIVTPSVELVSPLRDPEEIMRFLESAIRTAYKSEDKIGPGSHEKILKHILSLKHESTLEHIGFTFRIVTSRGVTHELVRHRLASYTQESTRYVGYDKHKPKAILPWHLLSYGDMGMDNFWLEGMETEFALYLRALKQFKWKPQEARGFLPNDCKTEIVTTMSERLTRLGKSPLRPDHETIHRNIQEMTDQADAALVGVKHDCCRS